MKKKAYFLIGTLGCFALVAALLMFSNKAINPEHLVLLEVERADLVKTVTGTGKINPVNIVTVGTQVSGYIESIYVDFNDAVVANQILAKLDTSILAADVENSRAQLQKAQSNLKLAKIHYQRVAELYEKAHAPRADLDIAEVERELAEEEVKSAKTLLESNEVNLTYAIIRSPVSGVVISREVDVGQTVAAMFQTPELFLIAEDLSQMQIETNISEADIGMIAVGQPVVFTVDAYPDKTFTGEVEQVRLNPIIEHNVVTYNVIMKIANPDLLLMPGMTAFVSVVVGSRDDVLNLPNSAFRFKPPAKLLEKLASTDQQQDAAHTLYVWRDNAVHAIGVDRGLNTLTHSEVVTSALQTGDQVIVNYLG